MNILSGMLPWINNPLVIIDGMISGRAIKDIRLVLVRKYPTTQAVSKDNAEICASRIVAAIDVRMTCSEDKPHKRATIGTQIIRADMLLNKREKYFANIICRFSVVSSSNSIDPSDISAFIIG